MQDQLFKSTAALEVKIGRIKHTALLVEDVIRTIDHDLGDGLVIHQGLKNVQPPHTVK